MNADELSFLEGAILEIRRRVSAGWWKAKGPDGRKGLVPTNYIEPVDGLEQTSGTEGTRQGRRVRSMRVHGAETLPDAIDETAVPFAPQISSSSSLSELAMHSTPIRKVRTQTEQPLSATQDAGVSAARLKRRKQQGLSLLSTADIPQL
jgi:hypothetical protein